MILYKDEICGRTLLELNIPHEVIKQSEKIFSSSSLLREALSCPAVLLTEKFAVIDRVFPQSIRNYLKIMCQFGYMNEIIGIFNAYDKLYLERRNILTAQLEYAAKPDEKTVESFRNMLKKKYGVFDVYLGLKENKELIGGYRLTVGDKVFDKSIQSAVKDLQNRLIRR